MLRKRAELVCLNRDPKAPKDTVSQIFSNKISKSPTHMLHKYSHDMGHIDQKDSNEDARVDAASDAPSNATEHAEGKEDTTALTTLVESTIDTGLTLELAVVAGDHAGL